jgi:hypothetical protein
MFLVSLVAVRALSVFLRVCYQPQQWWWLLLLPHYPLFRSIHLLQVVRADDSKHITQRIIVNGDGDHESVSQDTCTLWLATYSA